ncbi:GNAT family N-acetyltransferase [Streptomyces caniscabiei]|uniref:GNAT family N-acetyltransferase n=1 Tax=Streptomyces caniscabiei TaxID=2746961 RepID=UPI00187252E0|nr:GNAT family protein [Streptomyces caniscabiei]MBE4774787.1 GNAT family N-acetyltransferase [Streptomyces caniscabiei]MDX2956604.1 GNAT family protein [Streptomyces caniscabiei]
MIRSLLRRRRAASGLPVPDRCTRGRHALATPHLLFYTPVTKLDALAAIAAGADPEAQRWQGSQMNQVVPDADTRRALLRMGPAGATPRWFLKSNPELAEPFEPSPELADLMVCVRRGTGRYAGYLDLDRDRGETGGTLAPDHRGQRLGAELFLAAAEFAHGHAGLPTVRAGTATANLACRRALGRADFVPAPGPARHTLPDGRELDTVWYRHDGPASTCAKP